jgi:hypothetical protein
VKAIIVGPERRVCRMQPGEVKRFPADWETPVGFYVACPACGSRNFVLASGQHVSEVPGALTLSPGFYCDGPTCDLHIHIKGGELVVTDDRA